MDESRELPVLIEGFIEQAILQGRSMEAGTADKTTQASEQGTAILDRIRTLTGGDMQVLRPLLAHESGAVRGWAAAELLPSFEEEAIAALQQVDKDEPGFVGFTAKIVLQEWAKGNWKGKPYKKAKSD